MKALVKSCGSALILGLNTRALLIHNGKVVELKSGQEEQAGDDKQQQQQHRDPKYHAEFDPNEVQCVALAIDGDGAGDVWCAVSRYGKSLSIYRNGELQVTHETVKRAGCLAFAWITTTPTTPSSLGMVIAGDMVGDATAYPLDQKPNHGRLLLGHTASILTEIRLINGDTLLTADRDEKVRLSNFPQTGIVKGYLLGHTAFISSMDTSKDLCVTCGGDMTVRLWNTSTLQPLAMTETNDLLPTQVSTDGERVAVIFHNSNAIHVYSMEDLRLLQTIESSTQPLGVSLQDSTIYVLAKEPMLLQVYQLVSDKYERNTQDSIAELIQEMEGVTMPSSILEADKNGQLKLEKLSDNRGAGGEEAPWHRVDRVEKAKESRRRHKKKQKTASS